MEKLHEWFNVGNVRPLQSLRALANKALVGRQGSFTVEHELWLMLRKKIPWLLLFLGGHRGHAAIRLLLISRRHLTQSRESVRILLRVVVFLALFEHEQVLMGIEEATLESCLAQFG